MAAFPFRIDARDGRARAGAIATPRGELPTFTVPTTVLVAVSTTDTLLEYRLVT